MRSRSLIIIAALVVAVGAFIFFVERHQPTSDERAERADRVFDRLEPDEVTSIELRTGHGPIRLARTGERWRLTAPLDYPADTATVRTLLQALAELDTDRSLAIDEVDPGDYGLDSPTLGVVAESLDGTRFSLEVGEEMPLGSKRAVRREEDDEILLCPGAFVTHLDREVDDWRSRDVVDVLERDLASVEITTTEDRIHVVQVGESWQLNAPVADLADAEQMRSLVSELNALRISEFLPVDTDVSQLGFDTPEYRIVLKRADAEAQVTLELARPVDDETSVVVRRNGDDLFRISDTIRTRLAKAPVLWRATKVWPFSSWDVSTVEIGSGVDEIVLNQVEDEEFGQTWRFADGSEADDVGLRRRLTALADLEAREHDLVLPPTEVLGSVILLLEDDGAAEGLTYTFYAPLEEGGLAAATVSSRANVMGVDAVAVETIIGDLDSLRPAMTEPTGEENAPDSE